MTAPSTPTTSAPFNPLKSVTIWSGLAAAIAIIAADVATPGGITWITAVKALAAFGAAFGLRTAVAGTSLASTS